jgi:hypothetical protein
MPKSKNKRKNGKVKKYKPKPNGISKKKLEQLLKNMKEIGNFPKPEDILEIRDESVLEINDPDKKKYNIVLGESEISQGPELSKKEDENLSDE